MGQKYAPNLTLFAYNLQFYNPEIPGLKQCQSQETPALDSVICGQEYGVFLFDSRTPIVKVKGLDIYIPPLTGKLRPAAVYN